MKNETTTPTANEPKRRYKRIAELTLEQQERRRAGQQKRRDRLVAEGKTTAGTPRKRAQRPRQSTTTRRKSTGFVAFPEPSSDKQQVEVSFTPEQVVALVLKAAQQS